MTSENVTKSHLGQYELLECLEEGITGELFRARDTESGQNVLLKLVAQTVSDNPAFQRYFYDKGVQQPSLIEHPNVLQVIRAGQEAGLHYVAIADVGGERLSQKLKDAPLPLDDALDILRQIAEGVRSAHQREMVHGHLKPSDIILTADKMGRPLVKVVFFDLGVGPTESMVSMFGEVTGAPKYMAPEVIRGRSPSPQSDLFSLGVIAYELLTGKEPFPSDHALGYLFANCQIEPAPADKAAEGVPHEISLIAARLLEKDAARRYKNMQRVIDDLDRCAESMRTGHVEVVPYGTDSAFARDYQLPEPKAPRGERRRPSVGAVVALLFVTVTLGIALGWYFFGRSRGSAPGGVAPGETPVAASQAVPVQAAPGRQPLEPQAVTEATAREAYEAAAADWERYSQTGGYEMGIAAFRAVAEQFAETPYAHRAGEQMGRIYTEWAHAAVVQRSYADAVDRYAKALAVAPQGSQFAELARRRLPAAMASQADDTEKRGRYREAMQIYEQIAQRFSGSIEATLWEKRRPRLLLNMAYAIWHDDAEYDDAVSIFEEILRKYPGTEHAKQAMDAMPSLYLDSIEQKLGEGELAEARQQLLKVTQAYPEHEAAAKAADLDAQILFGLFQEADRAGNGEDAAACFGELLRRHPSTRWTVQAARLRLDLRPTGAATYDSRTALWQVEKAEEAHEKLDFADALGKLKGVIRHAREDSPAAATALTKLPEWLYEEALHGYGKGARRECEKALGELATLFANTSWGQRAADALERIERPLPGMVYVPEGRFIMGTDMREITSLVRRYALLATDAAPETVEFHAELYGLLNETPQHLASTGAFYIDRTEVTNKQYKEFVDETGYPAPAHWTDGNYPEGQDLLPVVQVRYADAEAYAAWAEKRLPTEAEWEKAARGVDGRRYPWGAVFEPDHCRHMRGQEEGPVAVGSFRTYGSPYGCQDMIGNVLEWTSSWFAYYPDSRAETPLPAGPTTVTRGGPWYQETIVRVPFRCATRYNLDPARAYNSVGFRCVRDVSEAASGETGPAGSAGP